MTNLTHLSDAELDTVTGGFFNYTSVDVTKVAIAKNVNITPQSETNVGILQLDALTGGGQSSVTGQSAVAIA